MQLAADILGIRPRWKKATLPEEFPDFLYEAATVSRTLSIQAARDQLGYEPRIGWRDGLTTALDSLAARAS